MTQQETMPVVGSCDTLLDDYFRGSGQQDLQHGKMLIDCSVSAFLGGNLTGIFGGTLEFSPQKVEVDVVVAPSFSGELTRHYTPRSESSSVGEGEHNEHKHIPHRLHITISGRGGPVMHLSSPSVAIAVEGQGGSQTGFKPQCLAGSIYGVGEALHIFQGFAQPHYVQEALYVIGLRNQRYVANA